jgi:hypothetical protein
MDYYDKIIFGAGIYGLYAAKYCAERGEKVLVLEYDNEPFSRATFINQARVHNGYHYPRSFSTAIKSAKYFDRFNEDFSFAVNNKFKKIYATSSIYSLTSADQFRFFCDNANIRCDEIESTKYFKNGMCDGVFETEEYTFDANIIKNYFIESLKNNPNVEIQYGARIAKLALDNYTELYNITMSNGDIYGSNFILNATYASTNQISHKFGLDTFNIKYEICEVILCSVDHVLQNVGITVMDGPFFSIMPFGKTGLHSLTTVSHTPHKTSYESLPTFSCQKNEKHCSPLQLSNCNLCQSKPKSAWTYMSNLVQKYLKNDINFEYKNSLFSVKPILMSSEVDDSRPTIIREQNQNPKFISVLSGKINTIYDLNDILIDNLSDKKQNKEAVRN